MGELHIIPMHIAEKLAPSAGLRNRLVHAYDTLENSIILDAVKTAEELYSEYIKAVDYYIAE